MKKINIYNFLFHFRSSNDTDLQTYYSDGTPSSLISLKSYLDAYFICNNYSLITGNFFSNLNEESLKNLSKKTKKPYFILNNVQFF